ncbi:MAG: peptide deformylase [Alphaproteobacteria bacterium]|nr:peptide deformylase [Alphaproteobacteria bacterium]
MAKLEIITAPDPRLKATCKPVARVDEDVRRLMDDMLETMYAAPGIGLAAPQVGVAKRVIVVDTSKDEEARRPVCLANPAIVWHSDELASYEEGCLSVPDNFGEVERPARVRVRYLDREGTAREEEFDGLLATCVQHEMDHLDGVLFIDHLSLLKRNIILRKLTKARRQKSAAAE